MAKQARLMLSTLTPGARLGKLLLLTELILTVPFFVTPPPAVAQQGGKTPQKQTADNPAVAQTDKGKPTGGKPDQKKGGGKQTPVVVDMVRQVSSPPLLEFSGLIEPSETVLLSSDVQGRMKTVLKRQGEMVQAGETIMILENLSLSFEHQVQKAKLLESEALVEQTQRNHKRIKTLFRKKLTSVEAYEESTSNLSVMNARLASGKAQLNRLEDQLKRMTITSPITGQIVSESPQVGKWVAPNQVLASIYNYGKFEVRLGIPGRYINKVPGKGRVTLRIPELKAVVEGRILAVIRHVKKESGTFIIRVGMDNPQGLPFSGLIARVNVPLGDPITALTVPRDAVVRKGNRIYVVTVENGKARIVPVRVKGNLADAIIVKGKGLKQGLQVVVRGNERLRPGSALRIINPAKGEQASPGAVTSNGSPAPASTPASN